MWLVRITVQGPQLQGARMEMEGTKEPGAPREIVTPPTFRDLISTSTMRLFHVDSEMT